MRIAEKLSFIITVLLIVSLCGCNNPAGDLSGSGTSKSENTGEASVSVVLHTAVPSEEEQAEPEPEPLEDEDPDESGKQQALLPHETAAPAAEEDISEGSGEEQEEEPEELSDGPGEEPAVTEQPEEENGEDITETEYLYEGTIPLDPSWEFADFTVINTGTAFLYRAGENRKNIIVGVNAGHGTEGGNSAYVQCHPDGTPKVTGGTNAEGSVMAMAASAGMTFSDGTAERDVNLREAQIFKEVLLASGYDVLMIRDGSDVQLDNIARTVICNNLADCHIAIHWDGDGLDYDKGCFYASVPDGIKQMYPVSEIWPEHDRLGECLITGLSGAGCPIMGGGSMQMDLTQTSFSTIPSVDIELGNAASDHSDEALTSRAYGMLAGVDLFFGMAG